MNKEGGQVRNTNAVGHGLHSKTPARRIVVQPDVSFGGLAIYTNDLVDASLWVARELEQVLDVTHSDAGLISLYGGVAGELAQLAGELQGETGIKAASLGTLSDAQYEALMRKQAEALSLILSQCVSAWKHIQMHQELAGSRGLLLQGKDETLYANPVLTRLAGHMRTAKRLIRDMAANVAWRQRGQDRSESLTDRVRAVIEQMQQEGQ